MQKNWTEKLDDQERKMSVATMFLNNLVEGDIQIPGEAVSLSQQALTDLGYHEAMLSTIRRKLDSETDPDSVMNQPSLKKAWTEISAATDKVLDIQDRLIHAYDQDLMKIVSREEMESIKGSPLSV